MPSVKANIDVSHLVLSKVKPEELERLRGRMMQVAMRYANALAPDDAREVQRFFQRCRARIGAQIGVMDLERADDSGGQGEQDGRDTTETDR